MNPLKTGLARLLCDVAEADPIVLPFHHSGMEGAMRVKTTVPRVNQRVRVLVGEPLDMADLLARCRAKGEDKRKLARDIMARVEAALEELRARNQAGG